MPAYVAEDRTDRRARELRVTQHVGGTHHAVAVDGGRWFQAFGNELLLVDATNGREIGRAEGVPFGSGGSLVDLVVRGDAAWAVSDFTALVRFDVSGNEDPRVAEALDAAALGIEPRLVSMVGDDIYASGRGGVVRLRDRRRFLTGQSPAHVVASAEGPVACVGRRILALDDGRYVGAASDLVSLPSGVGTQGAFAFMLQGQNGASVGLMSPAFLETDHAAIPARVRRIRVCGDRLFAVTDRALLAWRIDGTRLADPEEIALKGGRDLALLRPNHYAVCGSFGRAMYRHRTEDRRDGDTFYNVDRQPGLLEVALSDGRRVLAGGREGFWLWRIGGQPELTDKTTDLTKIPSKELAAAWGSVRLIEEKGPEGQPVGVAVEVRSDGQSLRYQPDGGPRIHALELVDGDVWIGHDRGLDVLRRIDPATDADGDGAPDVPGAPDPAKKPPSAPPRIAPVHEWRFEGPVLFIYPERLGGGASVVSLHGGFVLLKPEAVGEAPVFEGRGDVR